MGCGSSVLRRSEQIEGKISPITNTFVSPRSPLTQEQINSRIVSSTTAKQAKLSDALSVTYAFVSQRGYYPDALDKPNQDATTIVPTFNGKTSQMYFGVFDGHGSTGDLCANYAKRECPERLLRLIEKKNSSFVEAYSKSFEDTNTKLHASRIDDSLSGTTAVTLFLDNDMIHVANVGDSRAVIATVKDGKLVASPLSVDQTPYRSDERDRVKRSGARVLTMDQLEGIAPIHDNWAPNLNDGVDEDGDPPRIWSPYGAFPGTAFTRSIGDEIAETLGVIATPEITSLQLTYNDKFVVLASDGVFEFMTSQTVVDIISRYDNPFEACEKVVAEAYRLWLSYELRTDDISIICVRFEFPEEAKGSMRWTPRQNSNKPITPVVDGLRPVRKGMSKEKRRAQMRLDMAQLVKDEDLNYRVSDHTIQKSSEELEILHKVTKGNWLFRQLTMQQRDEIFAVMEKIKVDSQTLIIRQGDVGDKFYIVQSGTYQVSVLSDDNKESIVHTYVEKLGQENPHASFGELSLMHNSPRSSSVLALTEGILWGIDCRAFRRVFVKAPTTVLVQTLKKVDVLRTLTQRQLERLADNLTEVIYQDGDYIIKQGETGNTFYVIQEGAVVCTITEEDQMTKEIVTREVLRLKKNQYFGERALLNDSPRAANVIAVGRTKLLMVARRDFEEVLGSLQVMLDNDRQQRESRHKFDSMVKELISTSGMPKLCGSAMSDSSERRKSIDGNFPTPVGMSSTARAFASSMHIVNSTLTLSEKDLRFVRVVETHDVGYIALYCSRNHESKLYTVNTFSFKLVKKENKVDEIVKYVLAHKTLVLNTPLVPNIVGLWKDDSALYVALDTDMVTELAVLLAESPSNRFVEDTAKIFCAQTLIALEYIHLAEYAYRNISSDSILVDTKGYIQLHDFRHMKLLPDESRTYTICGTPEYMAPEMVSARGHQASVDIWALGILLYEMLCGCTPFVLKGSDNLNENDVVMAVYSKISRHRKNDIKFPENLETELSEDVKHLIQELLNPFADSRYGCQNTMSIKKGGSVIREHSWFDSVDWVELAAKVTVSPYAETLKKQCEDQIMNKTTPPEIEKYTGDLDWTENF